ncbi:T9SS type B sorting domain-containing protein [Flavobacterium sp. ZB4P13]|uniref:T9SS type B sorting domain-containing protein n=1 Tax=Flavobacterium sp. ZB4P13 TaxID=3401728 RepID=UPI003AAC7481
MEKYIKSFAFVCFVNLLLGSSIFGQTAPPTPNPQYLYYCLNDNALPLSATPSGGGTLRWYTTATGGVFSTTAPTPSTATAATGSSVLTYYVTQIIGGVESTPRTPIYVYVDQKLDLFCVRGTNSIKFDFANTGQSSFTYSYTIDGGFPITGTHIAPSNFTVAGLNEGQTVTFTLTAVGAKPCVTPETEICTTTCSPANIKTPNFPAIPPFCSGTAAPLLTNTSPNGITGTWSPALINNTTSGSYVFTPNPTLFPCATTQTLNVTVRPLVTPTFTGIPATVCQNATAPILPTSSSNATPITGTWSPATVDTAVLGPANYTFTPNLGQCVSSPTTTITITVNPNITPTFTQVPPICSGAVLSALPTTSNNNFRGTWSPALNNTATTTYTFTPTAGQCTTTTTMTITVTPNGTPTFNAISPICTGTPLAPLPTTSNNNYTGSWSPALNNTATTTYTFAPDAGQCATTATLTITVNPLRTPVFNTVPTTVCENAPPLVLPTSSSNIPAITGAWSPPAVDTSILGASDYTFTPDAGQCAATITKSITVAPSNTLVDVNWTVTEAFAKNQIVTINATAAGDYLYQLDDGPFQESPVFEYVSLGTHSITVQDKNGCSLPITRNNVLVVNYPKFFTPNSDGYNDTWNIFALQDQSSSKILIFDRYGKFLKEIFPNGSGWDGTYIGQPMPANDYWFSIEYTEQDIPKKFKSHFSLKR